MKKKREGQIATFFSMFMVIFSVLIIGYQLQLQQFRATKTVTEDALAASNLASAVIDIEEYGSNHNIIIKQTDRAFQLYKDSLKVNLKLTGEWECENKALISGQVEIVDYIIYNVQGEDIEVFRYGKSPGQSMFPSGLGSVSAPNGQLIESTSIYSKITFPVEAIFDVNVMVMKDKLVDIVGE